MRIDSPFFLPVPATSLISRILLVTFHGIVSYLSCYICLQRNWNEFPELNKLKWMYLKPLGRNALKLWNKVGPGISLYGRASFHSIFSGFSTDFGDAKAATDLIICNCVLLHTKTISRRNIFVQFLICWMIMTKWHNDNSLRYFLNELESRTHYIAHSRYQNEFKIIISCLNEKFTWN